MIDLPENASGALRAPVVTLSDRQGEQQEPVAPTSSTSNHPAGRASVLGAVVQRIATDLMIASERHEGAVLNRTCRQIGEACGARAIAIDEVDITGETVRIATWRAKGALADSVGFAADYPLVSPSLTASFLRVDMEHGLVPPEVQTALHAAAALVANFRSRVAAEVQLRRQVLFTSLLRSTSERFAALRSADADVVIPRALGSLGDHLGASIVSIWTFDHGRKVAERRYRWMAESVPDPQVPAELDLSLMDVTAVSMTGGLIDLADPYDATGEAEGINDLIRQVAEYRSSQPSTSRRLAVPMMINRQRAGLMVITTTHSGDLEEWEVTGLRSFASLVPEVLQRFEAEELLSAAFRVSPVAISLRSIDGELLDCNDAMCDFLGRSRSELMGSVLEDVRGTTPAELDDLVGDSWTSQIGGIQDRDVPFRHRDGHIVWGRITATVLRSAAAPVVLSHIEDVTLARSERERLREQAMIDELTGLPNRHGIAEMVSNGVDAEAGCALLMIDLDGFKTINDQHGHPVGDALLRVVGERLSRAVRSTDRASRYGGDEFLVLLEGPITDGAAAQVAENIHQAFARPIVIEGEAHRVGLSIGGTLVHGPLAQEFPLALERADRAMYRAKAESGRSVHMEPALDAVSTD